jgi:hypothetical protein
MTCKHKTVVAKKPTASAPVATLNGTLAAKVWRSHRADATNGWERQFVEWKETVVLAPNLKDLLRNFARAALDCDLNDARFGCRNSGAAIEIQVQSWQLAIDPPAAKLQGLQHAQGTILPAGAFAVAR